MCNNADHIYYGKYRRDWMEIIEVQIDEYINRTARELALSSAARSFHIFIISYLLLLQII